jgi:hypothetical protein
MSQVVDDSSTFMRIDYNQKPFTVKSTTSSLRLGRFAIENFIFQGIDAAKFLVSVYANLFIVSCCGRSQLRSVRSWLYKLSATRRQFNMAIIALTCRRGCVALLHLDHAQIVAPSSSRFHSPLMHWAVLRNIRSLYTYRLAPARSHIRCKKINKLHKMSHCIALAINSSDLLLACIVNWTYVCRRFCYLDTLLHLTEILVCSPMRKAESHCI